MKNFFCAFLIIAQILPIANFFENFFIPDYYVNTINAEIIEFSRDEKTDIKKLYSFIKENSVNKIDSSSLKNNILEAMVNSLDDPYASFQKSDNIGIGSYLSSSNGEYSGFGFDMRVADLNGVNQFVISNVMLGSSANQKGLKTGDFIISINGVKLFANNKIYEGALEISEDGKHNLQIYRNGENKSVNIEMSPYSVVPITAETINKNVYYMKINNCSENLPEHFEYHLKKIRDFKFDKVIIDLRHNWGGWETAVGESISMICENEIIGFTKKKEKIYPIERARVDTIINIKPIVLISENTASSAELFASQLREFCGATLIGSETYGKNQAQGLFKFGKSEFKFSTEFFSAKNDFNLKKNKIEPDIYIEEEYSDSYKDVILSKALELLN